MSRPSPFDKRSTCWAWGETGYSGKAESQSGSEVIPHGVGLLDLLSVMCPVLCSDNHNHLPIANTQRHCSIVDHDHLTLDSVHVRYLSYLRLDDDMNQQVEAGTFFASLYDFVIF